jgi:CRISPR/Cas system CMR-associated protein Cmr5 small subunit
MVSYMNLIALKDAEKAGWLWEVTFGSPKGRVSTIVIAGNGISACVEFARYHNGDGQKMLSCVTTALKVSAEKALKDYQEYNQGRKSADPVRVLVAEEKVDLKNRNRKVALAN